MNHLITVELFVAFVDQLNNKF